VRRRPLLLAAPALLGSPARAANSPFAALESRHGGWLGVAVLDPRRPRPLTWRGDERFPMSSTFKFLAVAHVLARVDQGAESLDRRITFGREDLVTYSPGTEAQAGGPGMTLAELCAAAVTLSDNTAGNLPLGSMGGPEGLTAWLRALGDQVTRLDRWELALNEAVPGDPRDTTSPLAMLGLMRQLLLGNALAPASRALLVQWLVASRTGDRRLRAGLPGGWRVGDKTGGGERNTTNDIAIFWPPGKPPVLVAAYFTGAEAPLPQREAVLAEVGRFVAAG
jgi:beta-lactamase class A